MNDQDTECTAALLRAAEPNLANADPHARHGQHLLAAQAAP